MNAHESLWGFRPRVGRWYFHINAWGARRVKHPIRNEYGHKRFLQLDLFIGWRQGPRSVLPVRLKEPS